jgi:hypothetical protein
MMIAMGGTLIIVVPMNDGIVISSDKRQIIDSDKYVDGAQKIHFLNGRPDLAFFGTGNLDVGLIAHRVSDQTGMVVESTTTSIKRYDAIKVVGEFLDSISPCDLDGKLVNSISSHCKQHIELELAKDAFIPFQHHEEQFYEITLVQYKAEKKVGIIGGFKLGYDNNGNIVTVDNEVVNLPVKVVVFLWHSE